MDLMREKGIAPIAIILLVTITIGGYFIYSSKINLKQAGSNPSTQSTIQPSPTTNDASQNTVSIQVLNEGIQLKNLKSQNYSIEGYIVNKNTCSCPKGAVCLPCLPEILVSEDKENTTENSRKIYIRVNNIDDFQLGKQYRFSILLPSDKDRQGFSYERRLIKYELVK